MFCRWDKLQRPLNGRFLSRRSGFRAFKVVFTNQLLVITITSLTNSRPRRGIISIYHRMLPRIFPIRNEKKEERKKEKYPSPTKHNETSTDRHRLNEKILFQRNQFPCSEDKKAQWLNRPKIQHDPHANLSLSLSLWFTEDVFQKRENESKTRRSKVQGGYWSPRGRLAVM